MKLENTYFILRHGETAYQTKKKCFVYPWPDKPQIPLTQKGKEMVKRAAEKLTTKNIDKIYSSDFFRTRWTAEIVAKALDLKVNFDKRLRDTNLGVHQGKSKKEFYRDFPDPKERFDRRPKKGESWNDIAKRVVDFLKEIDKKYKNKTILIVSHGDPLWLLEGAVKGLTRQELLDEIFVEKNYIKVGELRKLSSK